jgi:hypothetical protein
MKIYKEVLIPTKLFEESTFYIDMGLSHNHMFA